MIKEKQIDKTTKPHQQQHKTGKQTNKQTKAKTHKQAGKQASNNGGTHVRTHAPTHTHLKQPIIVRFCAKMSLLSDVNTQCYVFTVVK